MIWYFLKRQQHYVWMGHLLLIKFLRTEIQIKFIYTFKAVDGVKGQIPLKRLRIVIREVRLKKEALVFTHNQI